MDTIGLDLQKRESQLCVLAPDGTAKEQRIVTGGERFTVVSRRWHHGAPRGEHRERVDAPPRCAEACGPHQEREQDRYDLRKHKGTLIEVDGEQAYGIDHCMAQDHGP